MRVPLVILLFSLLGSGAFATSHPIVGTVYINDRQVSFTDTFHLSLSTADQLTLVFYPWPDSARLSYELESGGETYQRVQSPQAVYSALEQEQMPLVIYDGLPAGEYRFHTQLATSQTLLEAPVITISVQSSFFSRWWFVPLLILYLLLLFGGAVYFTILSNFRSKEKLSELRSDWTNKLHNDIGGDLSSVGLRLQMLKRKIEPLDPKVKEGVIKTHTILESIQRKLRFVFDLVDPKKDSLQVMLSDIQDFARENFALQRIRFDYRNELPEGFDSKLDIGRINKLYLAMKEVINNSVKYSEATVAGLTITRIKQGIHIEINDNGKGFDTKAPASGNGLKNLQQYSQEGLLDIDIKSQIGQGTRVMIRIPDL